MDRTGIGFILLAGLLERPFFWVLCGAAFLLAGFLVLAVLYGVLEHINQAEKEEEEALWNGMDA